MKRAIKTGILILLAAFILAACGKKKGGEESSQAEGASPGAGVSAATNVTLPEGGETIAYVLAARMVSDYLGNEAFVSETGAGGTTFWTTLNYLVSAYGTQNSKISASEDGQSYEVKLDQLRYYAAALYAELGKAKELPELSEMMTGVSRKSKKVYLFSIADTAQYRVSVDSSNELEDSYKIGASLLDSTSGETVARYAASIVKSAYGGKKSLFPYAVESLSRMTKGPMVQVLVGDKKEDDQTAQGGQTPPGGQGTSEPSGSSGDGTEGGQTAAGQEGGSSSSAPSDSSSEGGSSFAAGSSSSAAPTGTDSTSSSQTGADSSASADGASSSSAGPDTSQSSGSSGGGISNGSALEQAREYFGTSDEESGKNYVYSYEGTTTFNGTDYYNFYVTDGESYVTNILVSYDGSRILKGTKNADGSWSLQ